MRIVHENLRWLRLPERQRIIVIGIVIANSILSLSTRGAAWLWYIILLVVVLQHHLSSLDIVILKVTSGYRMLLFDALFYTLFYLVR